MAIHVRVASGAIVDVVVVVVGAAVVVVVGAVVVEVVVVSGASASASEPGEVVASLPHALAMTAKTTSNPDRRRRILFLSAALRAELNRPHRPDDEPTAHTPTSLAQITKGDQTQFVAPLLQWQTTAVSAKESRTTKRAKALLPAAQISVAIPAEVLHADGEPLESLASKTVKALFTRSITSVPNPAEKVLALTNTGTIVMSAKSSNAGIPAAVLAQTSSFPTLVDETEDGLVIALDAANYRIGRIHTKTMLSAINAIEAGPEPASSNEELPSPTEEPASPTEESPSSNEFDETAGESESESEQMAPPTAEASPQSATARATETTTNASPGRLGATASSWSDAFERFLFSDSDDAPVNLETRSRPTIQCQRLLRRHHGNPYVYLAVPGEAQPRKGTDDPKGKFLIAFTDDGVILFQPTRGNAALPRDVIGKIDSEPITFEPADYSAREGGTLTVGGRRYVLSRPYVRSLAAFLEQHNA